MEVKNHPNFVTFFETQKQGFQILLELINEETTWVISAKRDGEYYKNNLTTSHLPPYFENHDMQELWETIIVPKSILVLTSGVLNLEFQIQFFN